MKKRVIPKIYSANQLFTYSGLDGKTAFHTMLTLQARKERFTYSIVYPETGGQIAIPDYDGQVVIGHDFADFGPNRMLLADAWNLLIDGTAEVTDLPAEHYTLLQAPGRTLVAVNGFCRPELLQADFDALRRQKEHCFEAIGAFPAEVQDDDTAEAVARAWEVLRSCIYAPEEKFTGYWATPDRWPHRSCWIMDSVYQAIGFRYFNQAVAQDMVCALFAHQCENGRVPMVAHPGWFIPFQTQQPIIAAGVKAVGIHGDKLRRIYPNLKAYIEWDMAHRDLDGDGLLEWFIAGRYPVCPCGESGMDNSPRFDNLSPVASVDLNCFISLECEIMAEFAGELGLTADQALWRERHEKLNRLIEEKLWNPELEIYCDVDITDDKMVQVSAVSGFLPLICGAASPERAAKLAAHTRNPKTYGSRYPLPTVSISDPKFQLDMWRGPVWHIFNYHVVEGLDRYGFREDAARIRRLTVESCVRYCREFGGFFEFYDPEGMVPPEYIDRKGYNRQDLLGCYNRAVHDYGWAAAMFLDMLVKIQK